MTVVVWPSYSDDSGTGLDGTALDAAFFNSIETGINTLAHSATNPTVTPVNIIDEVVLGRKTKASLAALWDVEHNNDGTHNLPATVATASQLQSQSGSSLNLVKNSTFFIWDQGLALEPAYWDLAATASIVCTGTGHADTTRYVGKYAIKLTWVSGTGTLTQTIIDTTDFSNLDHLKVSTKALGFGGWVKSSIASHARLSMADGTAITNTSYHTGGGGWEWLSSVHTMSSAATYLTVALQVASSGAAYFSGIVANFAAFAPPLWFPEPKVRGSVTLEIAGALSIGDGKKYITFARPIRLDHIQGMLLTDCTGAALTIDFEKFEPTTTWASMGTAGALIDDGDGVGQWLLTTTAANYDHRCLSGWFGASGELAATPQENKMARLNIDQVGSSVAGSNLFLRVDGVQCQHPFEDQYSYGNLGV